MLISRCKVGAAFFGLWSCLLISSNLCESDAKDTSATQRLRTLIAQKEQLRSEHSSILSEYDDLNQQINQLRDEAKVSDPDEQCYAGKEKSDNFLMKEVHDKQVKLDSCLQQIEGCVNENIVCKNLKEKSDKRIVMLESKNKKYVESEVYFAEKLHRSEAAIKTLQLEVSKSGSEYFVSISQLQKQLETIKQFYSAFARLFYLTYKPSINVIMNNFEQFFAPYIPSMIQQYYKYLNNLSENACRVIRFWYNQVRYCYIRAQEILQDNERFLRAQKYLQYFAMKLRLTVDVYVDLILKSAVKHSPSLVPTIPQGSVDRLLYIFTMATLGILGSAFCLFIALKSICLPCKVLRALHLYPSPSFKSRNSPQVTSRKREKVKKL